MRTRVVVVPVIEDGERRVLLCRMAKDRGVFPGTWALPGGGVEPGERIEDALRREAKEELGLELHGIEPLLFKDAVLTKTYADRDPETLHMVFLVSRCRASGAEPVLNEEFDAFVWASRAELEALDLNPLTKETLVSAGHLEHRREA